MEPFLAIAGIIALVVVIRLIAGSFDGERVEHYVREQGWELLDRSWDPFGPGWFGEKESRIYQIVYRDRDGVVHRAHVKTSMFSGVYLTGDQVIETPTPRAHPETETLAEENRRLKKRIRELEEGRK